LEFSSRRKSSNRIAVKSLSASIIVLAAAILIASGGHMRSSDSANLSIYTGLLIGLGGLITWVVTLTKEK